MQCVVAWQTCSWFCARKTIHSRNVRQTLYWKTFNIISVALCLSCMHYNRLCRNSFIIWDFRCFRLDTGVIRHPILSSVLASRLYSAFVAVLLLMLFEILTFCREQDAQNASIIRLTLAKALLSHRVARWFDLCVRQSTTSVERNGVVSDSASEA